MLFEIIGMKNQNKWFIRDRNADDNFIQYELLINLDEWHSICYTEK